MRRRIARDTVGAELILVSAGARIDGGVCLGYLGPRGLRDARLIIGPGARIRRGTVIYAGTRIGKNLATGHNSLIREENEIGDNFCLWSNSVIDYGCRVGANVKVHSNCYVAQYSVLEDGVFLAPGVSFANDLHPGCPKSHECLRGPTIKRGARLGVNATVLPYVTVGEGSLIGAGSVVVSDVPPGSVVVGNPGRVIGRLEDLVCKRGLVGRPYPAPEDGVPDQPRAQQSPAAGHF
jgi:acetyltransferase-like isoleucine patch superfamily enzyme